jgi:hypothetical protein
MANEQTDLAQVENETASVLFQHTVLCQTGLPYRDPGDECRAWERANGTVRLRLEAGSAFDPDTDTWVDLGLPFGPKPRLILAHLNAEALRTRSPDIHVEASLTAFVRRILGGRSDPNGREIRLLKSQLGRLCAATIRLAVAAGRQSFQVDTKVVTAFDLWLPKNEQQRVLWPSIVRLSRDYFETLQSHAVPLHEHALAALSHNAMALDVYAWLAQRLHRIDPARPAFVPWKALKDQFGWHYDAMFKFRQVFRPTLEQVLGQYRGARIEVGRRGMTLRHSPPPVLCRRSPIITGSKPTE